jgi:hypothetical protein
MAPTRTCFDAAFAWLLEEDRTLMPLTNWIAYGTRSSPVVPLMTRTAVVTSAAAARFTGDF